MGLGCGEQGVNRERSEISFCTKLLGFVEGNGRSAFRF
jgi:hypothetical protein